MQKTLKIIFAGTPDIAKIVLENILASDFTVDLVLTQPDRPAHRGKKITPSPVKELASANNIEILQPESFKNNSEVIEHIRDLKPDVIVVVAYGLILPKTLLDIPRLGCINIHVSLLPKHRGAAPIQRAIIAGDKESGVTIMQMDTGMDTGNILMQRAIPIDVTETAKTLHDKLANLGSQMIIEYLHNYASYQSIPQGDVGVSYASKIDKAEAKINWNEDAVIIERKIRGFNPAPGCFAMFEEELIKIWQANALPSLAAGSYLKLSGYNNVGDQGSAKIDSIDVPGTIISVTNKGILVLCGNNSALLITELQQAGGKRQLASQYIIGHADLMTKKFLS